MVQGYLCCQVNIISHKYNLKIIFSDFQQQNILSKMCPPKFSNDFRISYHIPSTLASNLPSKKKFMAKTSFRPCWRSNFQIFLNFSHNYCHKFFMRLFPLDIQLTKKRAWLIASNLASTLPSKKKFMVKTSFRPRSRSNFQNFLNFSHNNCHKFLYVAISLEFSLDLTLENICHGQNIIPTLFALKFSKYF